MPLNKPEPARGEVWLVSLDPTVGHEIKKTRPAVVVTSDVYNEYNWVVVIVPLTFARCRGIRPGARLRLPEGGLTSTSVSLPDQIRAIDRSRLVKRLGTLGGETLARLDRSLRIVLGLP